MSVENSPTFLTSGDEQNISPKRKLDPTPPSEQSKSEEDVSAKDLLKKPRIPGVFNLVGYEVDDENDDDDIETLSHNSEGSGGEENTNDADVHLTTGLQFSMSNGPVTVFSSEHNLTDIQQAVESPQVYANATDESKASPVLTSDATGSDTLTKSDFEPMNPEAELPPEPPGHCSMALQKTVEDMIRKMHYDISFDPNRAIQDNKAFRNPSIYEKLVSYVKIDEKGTNFPPEVYNPYRWNSHSFYDKLAEIQNREIDRLEKLRKERKKAEAANVTAALTVAPFPNPTVSTSSTVTAVTANLPRTVSGPALLTTNSTENPAVQGLDKTSKI